MTLRAFRDVMDNRVAFYKIDITTFSQKEQQHVAQQVIGEPKLPAYIFIYKNGVLAKKVGSYDDRESAVSAADVLWRGFQDRRPGGKSDDRRKHRVSQKMMSSSRLMTSSK